MVRKVVTSADVLFTDKLVQPSSLFLRRSLFVIKCLA